jgi:hypothetical protein
MVKMEISRLIRRPILWLIFITGIILALPPVIQTWPEGILTEDYIFYPGSAYVFWMYLTGDSYFIYALIFPLLATLAYSDAYAEDVNTGLIKCILTRVDKKKYLFTRYIVNFFIGGLVSVFPLVINFLGQMTAYPLIDNNYYFGMPVVVNGSFWPELFYSHPLLYVLVRLVIVFFFGAALSSIGLAFSTWIKNRYIVIIFPFLVVLVFDVLLNAFDLHSLTLIFLGNIETNWSMIAYLLIGIIGSFICYFVQGDKNEMA